MLQWLKDILGDAYTEDIDKKVSKQIGLGFVARVDFNALSEAKKTLEAQLSDRDKQLDDLKKQSKGNEELQEQITKLQAANEQAKKDHEAEVMRLKIDSAVSAALTTARAKNTTAVKALLDLKDAKLADDGTIVGLKEQISKLTKADDTKFLFEEKQAKPTIKGANPGEPGDKKPQGITREQFTKMGYKERAALYDNDRETYDALIGMATEK